MPIRGRIRDCGPHPQASARSSPLISSHRVRPRRDVRPTLLRGAVAFIHAPFLLDELAVEGRRVRELDPQAEGLPCARDRCIVGRQLRLRNAELTRHGANGSAAGLGNRRAFAQDLEILKSSAGRYARIFCSGDDRRRLFNVQRRVRTPYRRLPADALARAFFGIVPAPVIDLSIRGYEFLTVARTVDRVPESERSDRIFAARAHLAAAPTRQPHRNRHPHRGISPYSMRRTPTRRPRSDGAARRLYRQTTR